MVMFNISRESPCFPDNGMRVCEGGWVGCARVGERRAEMKEISVLNQESGGDEREKGVWYLGREGRVKKRVDERKERKLIPDIQHP